MAFQRKKKEAIGAKAPLPGFIDPVLAEQVGRVPRGERWIHEIKYDGYRGQLHIANHDIKIFTRNGVDWTRQFRKVAHDADLISASSAIIDGEIVVPGESGKTDFAILQKSLAGNADNIGMIAFDLLYLDGRDLRRVPLLQRKAALKRLIANTPIAYSEHFDMDGAELFRRVCAGELEGVVSKIADSPYGGLRGNYWVKTTCKHRETLAIAGFKIKHNRFDGIYVGRQQGGQLLYAGKVEHGFEDAAVKDLQRRLQKLVRKTQPFAKRIRNSGVWVEPRLAAEVEYRAKSANGHLRHPFFKGLREDL
ncbi:non-homologous end-joining DNA ligase [Bradyrhizobium sp. 4]|uniref:non-homologous end-joining DNA ligase n=1 Tax=unclassified Bradyrhizobium TaxID=2631580 RepID=UPI001FFBF1A1|nr:non-homologous end-joining DNA ligase [Bradyrhizobium sp. 4]MCK1402006.1 non-homologous end-joining DNA ligase [Bradyrhizobium sp. 39]MCK1751274.1 non-homologous end-joining DNA ligase [Bradyrhizobium sp. 135]UPJ38525.1 non-homologous end-joining DNA ligase [Bradyrhizobium sp. 4]